MSKILVRFGDLLDGETFYLKDNTVVFRKTPLRKKGCCISYNAVNLIDRSELYFTPNTKVFKLESHG